MSGHSSGGRAQASQAWGRGFESRCPLQGIQARSSGGERYLDAVEVGGSKPPVPTMVLAS